MSSLKREYVDPSTGVTAYWFTVDGWVPNHPELPVLFYRQAISVAEPDRTTAFECLFASNGWPPKWRNGIYPFHHYHSTAHEVLGVADGSARVLLGGPHGAAVTVCAGDCVLLPAGTGHCLLTASPDLLVIGAYPIGQDWDLRRDALSSAERAAMAVLPFPVTDPVLGAARPLSTLWSPAT